MSSPASGPTMWAPRISPVRVGGVVPGHLALPDGDVDDLMDGVDVPTAKMWGWLVRIPPSTHCRGRRDVQTAISEASQEGTGRPGASWVNKSDEWVVWGAAGHAAAWMGVPYQRTSTSQAENAASQC